MATPITHFLLPAALVWMTLRRHVKLSRAQYGHAFFIAAIMGAAPDWDILPAFTLNSETIHRNWGHNFLSILVIACLGRFVLIRWISPVFKTGLGWVIALSASFSHVLLDSIGQNPEKLPHTGVPLLWPFSPWEFRLPLEILPSVKRSPELSPLAGYFDAIAQWPYIFLVEFSLMAAAITVWGLILHINAKRIAKRHSRLTTPKVPQPNVRVKSSTNGAAEDLTDPSSQSEPKYNRALP